MKRTPKELLKLLFYPLFVLIATIAIWAILFVIEILITFTLIVFGLSVTYYALAAIFVWPTGLWTSEHINKATNNLSVMIKSGLVKEDTE